MKVIDIILKSVDKIQDIVKIIQAGLAALEAFTNSLNSHKSAE